MGDSGGVAHILPEADQSQRHVSFRELRELAAHPPIRAWIELRRDQIACTGWDVIPKSPPRSWMWGPVAMRRYSSRRSEAVRFFRHPDPDCTSFASWLGQVAKDLMVTDAVAIRLRKVPEGHVLLGGDLRSLDLLDGATIDPLTDKMGRASGFAQYLHEVQRHDFVATAGFPPSGDMLACHGPEDVLYLRMNVRRYTPFGYSPLEQAIVRHDHGVIDADATAEKFRHAADERWGRACLSFLADVFDRTLEDCGAADMRWKWEEAG
jgi:hypothetical protein